MEQYIEIAPIGSVLRVDNDGYLVSQSSADKIIEPWKSVVNDVVVSCRMILDENLHSMYVRGSASRGEAIEGVSDLDVVVATYNDLDDPDRQALSQARSQLEATYPFCAGIELSYHFYEKLIAGSDKSFAMLKVYAVCVWGQDIILQLPQVKPGRRVMMHTGGFGQRIEDRLRRIDAGELVFNKARCTWIMKRLLRVGGELIMEREQVFVRDLYPCYALFAKYYPDKEPQIHRVLEYALNPVDNLAEVRGLIEEMVDFLSREARNVLVEHRGV